MATIGLKIILIGCILGGSSNLAGRKTAAALQLVANRDDRHNRPETDAVLECAGFGELLAAHSTLTGYYPSTPGHRLDGALFADKYGIKLHTLQDYLAGRSNFVTAAMDDSVRLPYGTPLCVPALNRRFGQFVRLELRDTDADLRGQGVGQLDICVATEADSYEAAVNVRDVRVYYPGADATADARDSFRAAYP